jgi:hypothetical protein
MEACASAADFGSGMVARAGNTKYERRRKTVRACPDTVLRALMSRQHGRALSQLIEDGPSTFGEDGALEDEGKATIGFRLIDCHTPMAQI